MLIMFSALSEVLIIGGMSVWMSVDICKNCISVYDSLTVCMFSPAFFLLHSCKEVQDSMTLPL